MCVSSQSPILISTTQTMELVLRPKFDLTCCRDGVVSSSRRQLRSESSGLGVGPTCRPLCDRNHASGRFLARSARGSLDVHIEVSTVVVAWFSEIVKVGYADDSETRTFNVVPLALVVEDFQPASPCGSVRHQAQCTLFSEAQQHVTLLLVKLIGHDVPDNELASLHLDTPRNLTLAGGFGMAPPVPRYVLGWPCSVPISLGAMRAFASARDAFSAHAIGWHVELHPSFTIANTRSSVWQSRSNGDPSVSYVITTVHLRPHAQVRLPQRHPESPPTGVV